MEKELTRRLNRYKSSSLPKPSTRSGVGGGVPPGEQPRRGWVGWSYGWSLRKGEIFIGSGGVFSEWEGDFWEMG